MAAKKLRLAENTEVVALNTPADYKKTLGTLPEGVSVKNKLGSKNNFVHLFVKNKKELEKDFFKVVKTLNEGALLWISYPKGSSGIQTDLTRDKGWECLHKVNMQWLQLISFDENWSAFLMKNLPPKKENKNSDEYHSIKNEWSDAATKTVKIPDDLTAQFKKNKKAETIFHALNFSNKKEYVMWIVGAKQKETKKKRLKLTIEKLLAGKKNPAEK